MSATCKQPLAGELRCLDLTDVLERSGCRRHPSDRSKWNTPVGSISIKGQKFMNWNLGKGGGGAIDLAIQLSGMNFQSALCWLQDLFPEAASMASTAPRTRTKTPFCLPVSDDLTAGGKACKEDPPETPLRLPVPDDMRAGGKACKGDPPETPLRLPGPDDGLLTRLTAYLCRVRGLSRPLVEHTIRSGKLYADHRGNAIFLLAGGGRVVGAEIRGTSAVKWHAMSPGSRKDRGAFSTGTLSGGVVVLCESAIDAFSCRMLHPGCMAISTSGATPGPAWLPMLLQKGFSVFCGFDADETGDRMAREMTRRFPRVDRLRPPAKDWNDTLRLSGWRGHI